MSTTRRRLMGLAAAAPLALALAGAALAADPPEIVTVVKIGGIPWFNAMEVGIQKEGKELGVNASMIGPTQADAAQQVRAVEDLIARKVDVIAVVPNDAVALEPVFKRAQEAGIKVLTHESPDQKNNDWNVELTSVQGFGETHMEALAKAMGGEGKYIVYVGSLTVPLHNKWADAAIALQKEKYPKMQLVADRFGVAESMDDSYKTALDQMRANPDLKGILAFGSQGPIGAARAVEERGKEQIDRRGRAVLAGPGRQIHQVGRHPRRVHLEPDAGGRGDRLCRRQTGQGRDAQGRHGHPRSRAGEGRPRDPQHPGAEAAGDQQGHHRRAGRHGPLSPCPGRRRPPPAHRR